MIEDWDGGKVISNFEWDAKGNLVNIVDSDGFETRITYTDTKNKCNIDFIGIAAVLEFGFTDGDGYGYLTDRNVFHSILSTDLPAQIIGKYGNSIWISEFSYKFDNDGYPIEIKWEDEDWIGVIKITYDNDSEINIGGGSTTGGGSSTGSGNNGGDTTGGSTTTYEKPDIGFYDFTATKTSLKVQYKIYNKDEAKVSSAKIYYGTSSNPSSSQTATVSGTLITANITGLKAGTTYYVKCTATGKGGTTTTTTTKCITNY